MKNQGRTQISQILVAILCILACSRAQQLDSLHVEPVGSICGNNILEGQEQCDNGILGGCSNNCEVDVGYTCTGAVNQQSSCFTNICGDYIKGKGEECDNGNKAGCVNCKLGLGYSCTQHLGSTSICSQKCGDGIKLATEQCDNGNMQGCLNCKIDIGYECIHNLYSRSLCYEVCGDGIRTASERCDNKHSIGCEANCEITPGYTCTGNVGEASVCKINHAQSCLVGHSDCTN